jgi:hypothetical protein
MRIVIGLAAFCALVSIWFYGLGDWDVDIGLLPSDVAALEGRL